MDWISVSAGCSAASNAIASASLSLNGFVREVRESRPEVEAISAELHSLDGILDLLRHDAAFFPPQLADHTPAVLATCLYLVKELDGGISILNRPGMSRADKKSRWLASRDHVGKLRWTLGEYKLALGLAADLVGVIKSQTSNASEQRATRDSLDAPPDGSNEDGELANLAAEILNTADKLREGLQENVAVAKLGRYLHVLEEQTLAAINGTQSNHTGHLRPGSSSEGEAPDSAIDMSYDNIIDALPFLKPTATLPLPMNIPFESWEEEIDEFVGELSEMPIRPPPLPPRSASRLSSARCALVQQPSLTDSPSGRSSPSPVALSESAFQAFSRVVPHRPAQGSYFTAVTEIPDQGEEPAPRPDTRTHSRRSSIFGQVLYAVWENPQAEITSPARPAISGAPTEGCERQAGLLRRSSSKLSTTFRNLGRRRPSFKTVEDHSETAFNGVFGVSLSTSMQVAKGIASTRHGDGASSVRATREYPLCVLRCVYHIRDEGLDAPGIFGLDADQLRLAQLKEVFNSAETSYGRDLDWSRFTVYDAADLILLFLSELSKPLISESVGKRWIVLSRQATMRAARLDQGLDFWEEAFMGIHGPARALLKLLLNLWGDIADSAEVNEMTAERLAGRAIRPLMHASIARHPTDFMLALAFMIRKRSEYNLAARGISRKSNAAF
ncbi:hypothetical protein VTI74DRAFT_370 [Chaetomium olivicolor]